MLHFSLGEYMISSNNFEYIGFWKRVLAALIDAIIGLALLPITIPLMRFGFTHKTIVPEIAYSIAWTVLWMWFIVKFGATPGKMVIKARIINSKGEFLNWNKAFLRMLFPGIIISINSHLQQWQVINTAPTEVSINSFLEIGQAINQYGQPFSMLRTVLGLTIYIDVLVVLANKRKRAIHDFIAGSYVVTKDSLTE
jgi:uncharacterized RDD family membrane protein YckC